MNPNYVDYIQKKFKNCIDLKHREIQSEQGNLLLIYLDTMCDSSLISEYIITPLTDPRYKNADMQKIQKEVLTISAVKQITKPEEAVAKIILGNVIILSDFSDIVIGCEVKNSVGRAPDIPPSENVVKGSREGFSEKLTENITLIRKRLLTSSLKIETLSIGKKSRTVVALLYMDGMTPPKLVTHLRNKIKSIEKESITVINIVAEKLGSKGTPFQTIGYTEKPAVAVSKLTEGKVIIMLEGYPVVLTAPYFFVENFQALDDYTFDKYTGNYNRLIRLTAFVIALLAPGLYIALTTHHFSLIPAIFVFRIAVTRAGVPFPIFLEVLLMMFFFNLLREAGVRLPQQIGPAISIVGALILGDAAVRAGLASTIGVLLVALSSICAFLIPSIFGSIAIWCNVLILGATLLGLPGFFVAFGVFCAHLAGLTTCSYPYLYPLGTLKTLNFKDLLLRDNLEDISTNFSEDDSS